MISFDFFIQIVRSFEWFVLFYFLGVNSFYALLLASAIGALRQHLLEKRGESLSRILGSSFAPTVSILAPAHNEASTIRDSLRALLALFYPNLEVVLINDGSSDHTMEVVKEYFDLTPVHPTYQEEIETAPVVQIYRSINYPNLLVIDKQNGGKADSLNAGLNLSTGELICSIDADTLIEPDALQKMVRPFLHKEDVVAAGGVHPSRERHRNAGGTSEDP